MTKLQRCTCNDSLQYGIIIPCPVHSHLPEDSEESEEEPLKCPICNTTNLEDISPTQHNGTFGPGGRSHKIIDLHKCPNCKLVLSNESS